MMFSGIDEAKLTGSISYTLVTTTFTALYYWGVDKTLTYGSTTILGSTSGIMDTAFAIYQKAIGAVMDSTTGLLRITPAQYVNLKNLNFVIGDVTYPNAQIWPRALNSAIGGTTNFVYLGLDFINGMSFLERLFDTSNIHIVSNSFTTAPFTNAETN
ncbi:hypothetical protein K438DRAFT_1884345 [Mycena galopus ATCC 62051]|nr:hypothetical protein K438DRAFT_1884345 [Mycena galopus ATCC 62051]